MVRDGQADRTQDIYPAPCRHTAFTWPRYPGAMGLWDTLKALWAAIVMLGRFFGWLLNLLP